MTQTKEVDEFDSLLFLEDRVATKARVLGREVGERQGEEEGWALGFEKGSELALEIGYYRGFATMWLVILDNPQQTEKKMSDRAQRTIEGLIKLLDQSQMGNPLNQ
eukprot:Ihof_evm8s44 gene=Ihof_evmTU8s44